MSKDTSAVCFNKLYRQINASDTKPGINQRDILAFPSPLNTVFNAIAHRYSLTAAEFATEFDLTEAQAKQLVDMLIDKGYLAVEETDSDEAAYKINYARNNPRKVTTDIWKKLDL